MLTLPGHLISLLFREFASFHVVEVFVCFLWLLFCPDFVCLRFVIFWIIDFVLYVGIWSLSIFVISKFLKTGSCSIISQPSCYVFWYILDNFFIDYILFNYVSIFFLYQALSFLFFFDLANH